MNEQPYYDEETLSANQDGYMTKAQRVQIHNVIQNIMGLTIALVLGFALVGFFMIMIIFADETTLTIEMLMPAFGWLFIFWAILLISGYGYFVWRRHPFKKDLDKGNVVQCTGKITLITFKSKSILKIKHFPAIISYNFMSSNLDKNQPYHVYYTEHSRYFLSLEPAHG